MIEIYDADPMRLQLEFAAGLDLTVLIKTTYDLEGDGLEILLVFDRVHALLTLGENLDDHLPNVDRILDLASKPQLGSKVNKLFQWSKGKKSVTEWAEGFIREIDDGKFIVEFPDEAWERKYKEKYVEKMSIEELKKLMKIISAAEKKALKAEIVAAAKKAFDYLKDRCEGRCDKPYDCSHFMKVCEMIRVFDPAKATELNCNREWVQAMAKVVRPFAAEAGHIDVDAMVKELPLYKTLAKTATFDRSDIGAYTKQVLLWWANNKGELPAWAKAAQVVFAFTPNSAACERVFSLLKLLFGPQQSCTLADTIQASLLKRYNDKKRGEN